MTEPANTTPDLLEDDAPDAPDAPKPEKKTKPKKAEKKAVEPVDDEFEIEDGIELLYLGKKDPKVVEMPDGCEFTFKRPTPRDHGKAVITCEACFIKLMNTAGPGAVKAEDVIFVPPAQLKSFVAMKNAEARKREESLAMLSQPWKVQEAKMKASKGEE